MAEQLYLNEKITLKDEDFTKPYTLDPSFKFIKKTKDPRFGDISLYQNPESRAVIAVKELRLNDKKQAEIEIIKCRKRMRNENQFVISIIDYSIEKQSSLCSSFYILRLYYEYPPTDLKRESANREKQGQKFSTEELIHLLYQGIEAHKHLELTKTFHGDVKPLYWGLNTHLWHSKLIYKPEEIDTKQKILQIQLNHLQHGDEIYQSPMMYENLMAKNLKFDFSPNKEDMFATGMVLLEIGIQESLQNVYQKNGKFDHEAMRKHVAKFESLYSGLENQLLFTTILTMIEPEESKRPHFILLQERMPSYYYIVSYFDNIRIGIFTTVNNPLERFIYIDKSLIEGFTLEPGIKQIKVKGGAHELPHEENIHHSYSDRNLMSVPEHLRGPNYIGDARIVARIIRRFEERDDMMIERVEHFNIEENGEMIKTEEYELIDGKKCNIKYFDNDGNEILPNKVESLKENKEDEKKDSIITKTKSRSTSRNDKSPRNSTINRKSDVRKSKSPNKSITTKSFDKNRGNSFNKIKSIEDISDGKEDSKKDNPAPQDAADLEESGVKEESNKNLTTEEPESNNDPQQDD